MKKSSKPTVGKKWQRFPQPETVFEELTREEATEASLLMEEIQRRIKNAQK